MYCILHYGGWRSRRDPRNPTRRVGPVEWEQAGLWAMCCVLTADPTGGRVLCLGPANAFEPIGVLAACSTSSILTPTSRPAPPPTPPGIASQTAHVTALFPPFLAIMMDAGEGRLRVPTVCRTSQFCACVSLPRQRGARALESSERSCICHSSAPLANAHALAAPSPLPMTPS